MKITKTQLKQIIKEEVEQALNKDLDSPFRPRGAAIDKDPREYYRAMKYNTDDPTNYSLGRDVDWPKESQILNDIATTMYNVGLYAPRYKRQWPQILSQAKRLLSKHGDHPEARKAADLLDALVADDNYIKDL